MVAYNSLYVYTVYKLTSITYGSMLLKIRLPIFNRTSLSLYRPSNAIPRWIRSRRDEAKRLRRPRIRFRHRLGKDRTRRWQHQHFVREGEEDLPGRSKEEVSYTRPDLLRIIMISFYQLHPSLARQNPKATITGLQRLGLNISFSTDRLPSLCNQK